MSLRVSELAYLIKNGDPAWSGTGSIFLRLIPTYSVTISDSTVHMFYTKYPTPWTLNFFGFSKEGSNQVAIGFYNGGEGRLMVAADSVLTFNTWANHLFTWDTGAPNQEYYANNVLAASSTAAFVVPSTANTLRFGSIDLGGGASQPANSYISEHGRWNRVLTAGERRTLQITGNPMFVPNGLVEYHPITALAGGGRDFLGNADMTIVGTPLVGGTPYRLRPESGFVSTLPAAPPAELEIAPPVLTNTFQLFAPAVTVEGITGISPPAIANPFTLFSPSVAVAGGDQTITAPLVSAPFTVHAPSVNVQETTIQEDIRELEPHNLRVRIVDFVAGDDLRITRTYTGLAEGIMIGKGYLTIKRHAKDDADAAAIVQKQITASMQGSGKITDNDTTGGSIELYFDLTKDDTALLTPLIAYHYDVQVVTTGSAVYTCEKGVIVMHQGVTHATS